MSFGAGIGAGMALGVGAGMSLGVSTGKKQAVDQLREYLLTHELIVRDSEGNEVPRDTLLSEAVTIKECCGKGRSSTAWIAWLLAGCAVLGVIVYLVIQ